MNKYIDQFSSLRSSSDILEKVGTIGKISKEITESMAVISRLKRIVLKKPNKYNILDLCAGHCLTSIIAAYLLPINYVVALDIREQNKWKIGGINNFSYLSMSIYDPYVMDVIDENTIIVSIHPCNRLAKKVIEIYNESPSSHLIMMPCCIGEFKIDQFLLKKLGKYTSWCLYLKDLIDVGEKKLFQDNNCISPKNIMILGSKKL